jgi:single-stranded-DNA-specific exonuclease
MSEMTALAATAALPAPSPPPPKLHPVPEHGLSARAQAARPRLEIPGYDLGAALALERELGVSHVLAQVLVRRGLQEPQAAREFLDPREVHAPAEFERLDEALELIQGTIRRGARITVHGDYDVDGICATALMVRALRGLGADADWFLPSRVDDGYGLSAGTVQRLAARGTDLLITVDCGITAVEEVAAARRAGLEVLVTDHHAPRADGRRPGCPIVHPALSNYPFPHLCGTGVALKLAQALDAPTAAEDVELVALATVADLMPLQGENRRLVRDGLAALANTTKPGLRALMSVSRADPSALDAHVLAFRLAPRINAAGRLRRPDAGLELLLSEDERRAAEIAAELDAVNGERRAVEQRIAWEAESLVAGLPDRPAFVLSGEGWHPGVIGIVASRIVERHHRPTILVALEGERGTGSGRSIPGFDLLGALHAAAETMERYGGHRAAAGLTVRRERVDALREAVERYAERTLTPDLLQPVERVDAVVSGSELSLALAEELAQMEPCGIGNPSIRLLVPGARLADTRPMGEGRHARFSVLSGGARARAVAFGCDGRLAAAPGEPCDATFRMERSFWNGAVEARLVLRHLEPCAPAGIDVVGEPGEYLKDVLAELDGPLDADRAPEEDRAIGLGARRTLLDRRGESPVAVLADAKAGGGSVIAICAEISRRLPGLSARVGGFSLGSYRALEDDPSLTDGFEQVVALDPPALPSQRDLLLAGHGYAHLAWGEAELRFAQQMHELEYGLRASLAALYRALRSRGRVVGEELEQLLRGDGHHARPARLAGRLIRVLAELELVSLDRDLPALAIAGTAQTALDRSLAYRAYTERYEDGRRYLNSGNLLRSG